MGRKEQKTLGSQHPDFFGALFQCLILKGVAWPCFGGGAVRSAHHLGPTLQTFKGLLSSFILQGFHFRNGISFELKTCKSCPADSSEKGSHPISPKNKCFCGVCHRRHPQASGKHVGLRGKPASGKEGLARRERSGGDRWEAVVLGSLPPGTHPPW